MAGYRKADGVLEIEWGGRRYRRHPNAKQRNHRVYWLSTTRRTYLHRDLYESVNGPLPEGWHVHHRNGDPLDNDPSNLVAVSSRTHAHDHYAEREARIYICGECGHEFGSRKWTDNVRWCSPACKERWRRRAGVAYVKPKRPYDDSRVCEECGAQYVAHKPWARFCSPVCRSAHGRRERKLKWLSTSTPLTSKSPNG